MDKDCYDKKNNRITYNRSKTKKRRKDRALSSIRIEPEIQGLIDKYMAKQGERLFYFGDFPDGDVFSHTISNRIYWMCKELNIKRMSPYWFRHTWATVARNKCGVSKDDIDLCLNHIGNNPMADVYIDYDWSIIDIANRKVLDYVFHSDKE
jgi:integrase